MLHRFHPAREAGFVLPLSITGALVLLLSSLSLQSVVLHTRQLQAAERIRLQAEDRLGSAAQRVAAALQGRFSCLQNVPFTEWRSAPLPAQCPVDLDPTELEQISIDGHPVQVAGWWPQADGGALQLQLPDGGLQRRFWLDRSGVKELG